VWFTLCRSRESVPNSLGHCIYFSAGFRGPNPYRIPPYSLGWCVAFKNGYRRRHIFQANVPGQVSPLAFGMTPAREAEKAGGMTKVPQAWGLTAPARSHIIFRGPMVCGISLAFLSASGGLRESWGWGNRKSLQSGPLQYFCCGMKRGGPEVRS